MKAGDEAEAQRDALAASLTRSALSLWREKLPGLAGRRLDLGVELVGELPEIAIARIRILEADGRTYLFYSVAGESGIAVAEIRDLGS